MGRARIITRTPSGHRLWWPAVIFPTPKLLRPTRRRRLTPLQQLLRPRPVRRSTQPPKE